MTSAIAAPANLLEHVGQSIWNFLKKEAPLANEIVKDVDAVAVFAEPVVDLAAGPAISPIYNLVVNGVAQAEATGAAALAGAPSGSNDAQKAAVVLAGIEPIFVAYYEKQFGVTPTTAQILAYINAVIVGLKSLPAPTAPAK